MALYQFPIHVDDHVRVRSVAGKAYSLADVYRASYKIGRSIFDATRPDLRGVAITRTTPSAAASLPYDWCRWPDDVRWTPSACARWCVVAGLPFVEVRMPPLAAPPGVALLRSSGRIVYPLALASTQHGVHYITAYADSLGYRIEWESEIAAGSSASAAVFPIS